jgi:catechol 2,3-dioxygenase-like lactoylglutathione lyase family enzyme
MQEYVNGFQHLGLPVTDLTRSRVFYMRLGFQPVMEKRIAVKGGTVQVLMMDLNGFILELYRLAGDELSEIAERNDGHIDHLALDVRDIDAAFEAVRAAGLAPLEDAPGFLPFWENGIKFFNVRGPDGEKVEFCERLKES